MYTKQFLLIGALFSTIFSAPQDNDRIVGGTVVSPSFKYPWIVSLQSNGRHFCGGIILNPTTVLTAAHCSQNSPLSATVNVHRHNLQQSAGAEGGQALRVSRVIVHPQYNPNNFVNDVSVWKLATPASVDIGSIKIDDGTYGQQVGSRVIAAGWGLTSGGGSPSALLREVSIPLVDPNSCSRVWANQGLNINTGLQVCAAGEGGRDACNGDSGGPLFTVAEGQAILIGTTSFGQPCAYRGIPTVWARVFLTCDMFVQYYADGLFKHKASLSTLSTLPQALLAGFTEKPVDKVRCYNSISVGSAICTLGLLLACFSMKVRHLFLTQGILLKKYVNLVNGTAVAGSGIGGLILIPVTQIALYKLGFRWAFKVQAIVSIFVLIITAFFIKERKGIASTNGLPCFGSGIPDLVGTLIASETLAASSTDVTKHNHVPVIMYVVASALFKSLFFFMVKLMVNRKVFVRV
ncbi:trypsin-like serine protease [Neoconidiobolus thromboides FSU 785]|nr:trypsin-like serine protease [Neoconidiobolus thromboides FSU 785]